MANDSFDRSLLKVDKNEMMRKTMFRTEKSKITTYDRIESEISKKYPCVFPMNPLFS